MQFNTRIFTDTYNTCEFTVHKYNRCHFFLYAIDLKRIDLISKTGSHAVDIAFLYLCSVTFGSVLFCMFYF